MAGTDEIGRKDVKNFDNMGIDKITEIINKIYNSNKILKEINFHSSMKESKCKWIWTSLNNQLDES